MIIGIMWHPAGSNYICILPKTIKKKNTSRSANVNMASEERYCDLLNSKSINNHSRYVYCIEECS